MMKSMNKLSHLLFAVSCLLQLVGTKSSSIRTDSIAAAVTERRLALSTIGPVETLNGDGECDASGSAVALSGDGQVLVVSSPFEEGPNQLYSGSVRAYRRNDTEWFPMGPPIFGLGKGDFFGSAVSLSKDGETLAVGAENNGRGYIRVYFFDEVQWKPKGQVLRGNNGVDRFGTAVSLSEDGSKVAVGAFSSGERGIISLFKWGGRADVWQQFGDDIDLVNDFATSVSLSADGTTVAAGMMYNSENANQSGMVRVFRLGADSTSWRELGQVLVGEAQYDNFGSAVALACNGNIMAVGSSGHGDYTGEVYVYQLEGGSWSQLGPTIMGDADSAMLGASVDLSSDGHVLAAGSSGSEMETGDVLLFYWSGSSWTPMMQTLGEGLVPGDILGEQLALSDDGRTLVAGAPNSSAGGMSAGQAKIYDIALPLEVFEQEPLCRSQSEGNGDPHFTTWKNEHFEFHGQCDIVMVSDKAFANGLGLDIHVRTKLVRFWSYIKTAAIRIGNDILEVEGSVNNVLRYWFNYEYLGELTNLGGFPVTINPNRDIYTIDLGSLAPQQKILIKTFKEFVGVKIIKASEETFGRTQGITGDFRTGKTFARDGNTVLDDFVDLGNEWQVLRSDGVLFHELEQPQFPEKCLLPEDPRGNRKRRLDESSVSVQDAEAACASISDPMRRKDCIYDVLATQDLDMVGAF